LVPVEKNAMNQFERTAVNRLQVRNSKITNAKLQIYKNAVELSPSELGASFPAT
jgi:hypothetical protein